jgi:hypothetical protein
VAICIILYSSVIHPVNPDSDNEYSAKKVFIFDLCHKDKTEDCHSLFSKIFYWKRLRNECATKIGYDSPSQL